MLGCAQLLWMKQTLSDFGLTFSHVRIKCNNTSAISISKNLMQYSRTKHIEIRHHFLRNHVQKGILHFNLLESKTNVLISSLSPLMRINLLTLEDDYGSSLCEKKNCCFLKRFVLKL